MKRVFMFFCLTSACSGATPPPVPAPTVPIPTATATVPDPAPRAEPAAFAPAPAYAKLFDKGRSWSIEGTTKRSQWDDTKGAQTTTVENWVATCRVSEVRSFEWGLASHIECEGMVEGGVADPVSGWWAATQSGLFHLNGGEPSEAEPKERLVLDAAPAAKKIEEQGDDGPDFGSRFTITQEGTAWCALNTTWGGDEGWSGICIDPAQGITSGQYGWAGGSTHEHTFVAR